MSDGGIADPESIIITKQEATGKPEGKYVKAVGAVQKQAKSSGELDQEVTRRELPAAIMASILKFERQYDEPSLLHTPKVDNPPEKVIGKPEEEVDKVRRHLLKVGVEGVSLGVGYLIRRKLLNIVNWFGGEPKKKEESNPTSSKEAALAAQALIATATPKAEPTPTVKTETQAVPASEASPTWLAKYEKMSGTQVLNEILSKLPSTKERRQGEEAYFLRVYKEISGETKLKPTELLNLLDLGLSATQDPEIRAGYWDLSFQLRQENHPILKALGFEKVDEEVINLAVNKGMHPEAYGISKEGDLETLTLLYNFKQEVVHRGKSGQFLEVLRPELTDPNTPKTLLEIIEKDPKVLMPNVEALVNVLRTETGFQPPNPYFMAGSKKINYTYPELIYPLCNIGIVPAKRELRGSHQGTFKDLVSYTKFLGEKLKLNFVPENIPGSSPRVTGDESGGAVGVQMMPQAALELYNFAQANFGRGFNIFTRQAATAVCLYFLRSMVFEKDMRFGYTDAQRVKDALDKIENVTPEDRAKIIKTVELDQQKGTEKWNIYGPQVKQILDGAKMWHENMIKTGKSEF